MAMRRLKRKLGLTKDQAEVVDGALDGLQEELRSARTSLHATRSDLAAALRGEEVDDDALNAAFAAHDVELERARTAVVAALKQIHGVLTPPQRAQASEWLSSWSPGGAR